MRVWLGIVAALVALTAAAGEPASYRLGAKRFVSDMARKHGFAKGEVAAFIGQASYSQDVIDAMWKKGSGLSF
jgi:membrane-bound lytic murein transglycosylase B